MQQINVTLTRTNPEEETNIKHLSTVPYFKKAFMRQSDCVCHLLKMDPSKPFDKLTMSVEGANSQAQAYSQGGNNMQSGYQPMRVMGGQGNNAMGVMNIVSMLQERGMGGQN